MTEIINELKTVIMTGETALGIEFGSTRIKANLIGPDHAILASGSYDWENQFIDSIWTYSLADIWKGLRDCYASLAQEVRAEYGVPLTRVGALGISGMMHGYMAFNQSGKLLVPFRTWRNTITGKASEALTRLFDYPIPQRWSIAHLYQAVLNGEEHVPQLAYLTTLAGFIHWQLTGEKVMGVGEASGMFPIDIASGTFNRQMITQFDQLVAEKGFPWKLGDILPKVLSAGEPAGTLTAEGAKLLDPSGTLQAGIPFCPPEGDAGTGMVATNSVAPRTGNVSAGTSVFAMVVLEKDLSRVYPEIDQVTTPAGHLVAMVHSNNCTSDLNAWVGLFKEFAETVGMDINTGELFTTLFKKALDGDADGGDLLAINYLSGEHITGFEEGRPLFVRTPASRFSLANFMRVHLYTSLGALHLGMNILFRQEQVQLDSMLGHGGFFKTPVVGQRVMAAAINTPVSVIETAGEGGPWGMALLAAYMRNKQPGESLMDYLSSKVFSSSKGVTVDPDPDEVAGYAIFMGRYTKGLAIERAAVENF